MNLKVIRDMVDSIKEIVAYIFSSPDKKQADAQICVCNNIIAPLVFQHM